MADNITLSNEEREKLTDELGAKIPLYRDRRKSLTDKWVQNHSAWRGVHGRSFFSSETFNHFIPAARRVMERFVTRCAQMLIPSSQFFEVYPGDELDSEKGKQAESVLAYFLYIFRKRIKIYPLVKQLVRCYNLYGRCILKTGVKLEEEGTAASVWPTARVVDPFMFFVWPETVNNVDDAQVIVEDNMMPWETYKLAMAAGVVEPLSQADLVAPVWPDNITKRLADFGIPTPSDSGSVASTETGANNPPQSPTVDSEDDDPKTKLPENFLFISEVWMRRGAGWWFVWLLWNIDGGPKIVRMARKTFKRPTYRMAISREVPGEHYSSSQMDDLEPLQVLLNDQFNMTLEGQAINFSPPTAIDIDMVSRASSITFRPRAKWFVKPEGVKFMETQDTTRAGYTGIQFTMGLLDSFSGSNPLAEGQPVRNLPRAGFAVSSLLQLSLADIKDTAQQIEDMILSPMLADLYQITVEMIPKDQVFNIPATKNFPARKKTTRELIGDFEFVWVGTLQAQDFQVRSQRLVELLGLIGQFFEPIQASLERQGKRLNIAGLFQRIWREGMGERGADSLIEDLSPQERLESFARQIAQIQAEAEQAAAAGGAGGGQRRRAPGNAEEANQQASDELNEGFE